MRGREGPAAGSKVECWPEAEAGTGEGHRAHALPAQRRGASSAADPTRAGGWL